MVLTSSWLVVLATQAARKAQRNIAAMLPAVAALLGTGFISIKLYEYTQILGAEASLTSNDFFMLFFVMTSLHAVHVALGIVALGIIIWKLQVREPSSINWLGGVGMFWHMIDFLWVLIFSLLYLIRWWRCHIFLLRNICVAGIDLRHRAYRMAGRNITWCRLGKDFDRFDRRCESRLDYAQFYGTPPRTDSVATYHPGLACSRGMHLHRWVSALALMQRSAQGTSEIAEGKALSVPDRGDNGFGELQNCHAAQYAANMLGDDRSNIDGILAVGIVRSYVLE